MTLRALNNLLRTHELTGDDPMDRLVGMLAILRSIEQGGHEPATDEGIQSSIDKFIENYGPVTTASVDEFMEMPSAVLDIDLPNEFILEMVGGE